MYVRDHHPEDLTQILPLSVLNTHMSTIPPGQMLRDGLFAGVRVTNTCGNIDYRALCKAYATCMSHNSLTQPYAIQVFAYTQVPYDKI